MCNFLFLAHSLSLLVFPSHSFLFSTCAQFVPSNQSSASVQSPTHTSLPQASAQVCKLISGTYLKYTALYVESSFLKHIITDTCPLAITIMSTWMHEPKSEKQLSHKAISSYKSLSVSTCSPNYNVFTH